MKKTIILALTLATAGFSAWSPSLPADQVSIIVGCKDNSTPDGTTATAIVSGQFNGNSEYQFLVPSSSPAFMKTTEMASQSVLTGKNITVEHDQLRAVSYSYFIMTPTGRSCYSQWFRSVLNIALKRN